MQLLEGNKGASALNARKTALAALLLILVLVAGCKEEVSPPTPPAPPVPPTARVSIAPQVHELSASVDERLLPDAFARWYDAYTASRIIEIQLNDREPVDFGSWSARREYGAEDAASDGALTEWAESYFVTHDWSTYGQDILSMQPGDTVSVNGHQVTIQRIFNYPKDGYYEEIMNLAGEGMLVFQTCYPDSSFNRIAYGS